MSSINIYLKLKLTKGGDVKGGSTVAGHVDEMIINTIRWGEENSVAVGGKGGHLTVREFEFTKKMCKGSVQMMLACASGDVVQEAVIGCRASNSAENVDFLKWTIKNGVIGLYEMEATTAESVVPTERVRIRFKTLAVEFKPRGADGKLAAAMTASIDVAASTAGN